jgi:beta-lactamase regulating signal transducer with metallopeptidase domain
MTSWFFLEMAAKSALICSLALLLAMALKHRAAADRATVLRVGAGLLLALPLIDLAFPVLEIEAFAAPAAPALAELSAAELQALMVYAESLPPVAPTIWDDPSPLIMILWGAGALAVLLRLFVGLSTLNRWTRGAEPVTDPHWLAALERARAASGASDRLRLMVADNVPGPLGWGWRNPVILIDYDTYAEREEADAILAHEVAHVARRDWPALMMTRIGTALFWFNPLVWTLARESIHQAEEAADAHAARAVEPTRYAETLLSWGQIGRGIACRRIRSRRAAVPWPAGYARCSMRACWSVRPARGSRSWPYCCASAWPARWRRWNWSRPSGPKPRPRRRRRSPLKRWRSPARRARRPCRRSPNFPRRRPGRSRPMRPKSRNCPISRRSTWLLPWRRCAWSCRACRTWSPIR